MKVDRKKPQALVALDAFTDAAHALLTVFKGEDESTLGKGYPVAFPSFDEVVHAITVWRDDATVAANNNLQATADRVIEILRDRFIGVVWEYPGYIHISVCPAVGLSLALGIDGDEWIGNTMGPNGDVFNRWGSWEPEPLPITSTPELIAAVLVKARATFLDRIRASFNLSCGAVS